ncbi:MAG: hypothetical protein IJG33_13575 [Selenomonadaceae bacterium]|nr:hypothetical protein [Selenomonadaceae bacterium]
MTNWLDNVVALNVKPSSMQNYRAYLKNQIVPHLGETKVQELTLARQMDLQFAEVRLIV